MFIIYEVLSSMLEYIQNLFVLFQIKINNQQDGKYAGQVISGHRFDKKLICIKYPGNIVNVDKAIETLGGISSISMV